MGVSDISRQISNQFLLRILRDDLDNTQASISSGKKSTTIAGLAPQGVSNTIGFRNKHDLLGVYTDNLNQAVTKFKVMDQAMATIAEAGRDVLTTLRKQLQDADPKASILSSEANIQLTNVLEKLNTTVNGKYVFAGDDVFNAPFANATTLGTNISAQVTAWMAGAPTSATVITNARAITGTALGYSASSLAAGNISFRADDSTDIDYTNFGYQQGYADVVRGLSIIANLPAPTTPAEQANYWSVVNGVITMLDEGTKLVDGYQGELGNQSKLADNLLTQHREAQSTFLQFIGTIEDADMGEASMKLQNLQTQLQASYSVIAQLKEMSLINFI